MSNETKTAPAESNSPVKPSGSRPLRVWPGVLLVVLMIVARFVPAYLEGGLAKYWMFAMMGPMLCCLLLVIWWLAASRATWKERVFGFLGLAAVFAITMVLVEPLMRGPGTIAITLPMGMIAFVVGAAFFKKRRPLARTSAALLLALPRLCFPVGNAAIRMLFTNKKGSREAAFFGGEVIRAYRSRRNRDPHSTNPFLPAESISRMRAKILTP